MGLPTLSECEGVLNESGRCQSKCCLSVHPLEFHVTKTPAKIRSWMFGMTDTEIASDWGKKAKEATASRETLDSEDSFLEPTAGCSHGTVLPTAETQPAGAGNPPRLARPPGKKKSQAEPKPPKWPRLDRREAEKAGCPIQLAEGDADRRSSISAGNAAAAESFPCKPKDAVAILPAGEDHLEQRGTAQSSSRDGPEETSPSWDHSTGKNVTSFVTFAHRVWTLFATERKPGWKNLLHLSAICCSVSFVSNVFLLLAGYSFLVDYPLYSLVTSTFLWIILSVGLCSSRHLRCGAALFFLSFGLREGRNALIAAGTGVVVAGNLQSIFYNLKQLADSVTCILESQRFPFLNHYVAAIWWIYSQLKLLDNPFKDIVSVDGKLHVFYSVSDEDLKLKLKHTRWHIQNITSQISSILALQPYVGKKVLPLLGIVFMVLGTYLFIRKFLNPLNVKFKNTYITKEFVRYNEQQWQQRKASVLPLNKEERKVYTVVPSFCQTPKERKHTARFFLPVLANLCIWTLFAAVDYLLYWLIFSVSKHLQDFPELEVHLKLYYHKNADKFIFNNGEIINNTTSFKIPLFKHACIPKPKFALATTWVQLAVIVFFLAVLGLLASTFTQLKMLVTTSFFPQTDMKRIEYLHTKLLNRRSKLSERNMKRKLNSFATLHFWFPILQATRNVRKEGSKETEDSCV
ncbi:dendritic cell-specific transmembrane protein [Eublepharis macularius]|uniref:Dendritic cell-specific transmembrane protein n=1 Tax=Eublepharis macularius TaxID=481883 RepID=A0AA97JRL6_EUBMA|nr:dendritic cell-specific transmembrane protein [Eublepharis macularius]